MFKNTQVFINLFCQTCKNGPIVITFYVLVGLKFVCADGFKSFESEKGLSSFRFNWKTAICAQKEYSIVIFLKVPQRQWNRNQMPTEIIGRIREWIDETNSLCNEYSTQYAYTYTKYKYVLP